MQLIRTYFFLVSKKINGKDYPIVAFDTEQKALEYVGDNAKENRYYIDNIDVVYEVD